MTHFIPPENCRNADAVLGSSYRDPGQPYYGDKAIGAINVIKGGAHCTSFEPTADARQGKIDSAKIPILSGTIVVIPAGEGRLVSTQVTTIHCGPCTAPCKSRKPEGKAKIVSLDSSSN